MVERKLVSIVEIGRFETYDIEVDHPDHNFILENGLCTSNSHAAAYAVICYVTGWLKTHYPIEFMTAILNKFTAVEIDKYETTKTIKKKDDESFLIYAWECATSGIKIQSPDVCTSYSNFIPKKTHISYGLSSIKGVGMVINDLIKMRDDQGGFKNFPHFIYCCVKSKVSSKVVKELYQAGAITLPLSEDDFNKYINGYQKSCRCAKKTGVANPACKLCAGNGLGKTLRTIFDDTKDFLIRDHTTEELDVFFNSFELSKDINTKIFNEQLSMYNRKESNDK